MKKAQNIIEIAVILCIVVAVSLTTWSIINKQKVKLVNYSKATIETAGASARKIALPLTLPKDEGNNDSQPSDAAENNTH